MGRVYGMVLSLLGFTLMMLLVFTFHMQIQERGRVYYEAECFLQDVCRDAVMHREDVLRLKEDLGEYEVETCVLRRVGKNVRLREFDADGWNQELYVGDEVIVSCLRLSPSRLVRFLYATDLGPEGLLVTEIVVRGMVFGEGGY
ncbi:hypothetical protein JR334_11685 [Clostridia bacterium]|nr:hypothetical protein JR334_11685 [Clostridia bacterium]